MSLQKLGALLLVWLSFSSSAAADFTGPVVSVLDGDTIEALVAK
jgi:endonuclease YncB( thermonuclease family)